MRTKNEDTLRAIIEFIDNWYFANNDYPTLSQIAEGLNIGTTTAHSYVTELVNRGEIEKNNRYGNLQTKNIARSISRADRLPIVGDIACGSPILAEENIESYVTFSRELLGSGKFFMVKDDAVRYYAITSIYRPWDSTIDKDTGNDNTITEVEYNISRQYAFGEINGNPYVNCVDIETIVVTDKFVGFVRYENGFAFFPSSCDSHFVAFNTDKPIDKLLEADVYYTTQEYYRSTMSFVGTEDHFEEKADNYAYLEYTQKVEHTGHGLFAGTYKWDRIQTVEDFIAGEETENIYHGAIIDVKVATQLTDSALNELKGKKWVLRFAETNYTLAYNPGATVVSSTIVGDVTILRLKFETDGITYNLGVIDNKQSGGSEPSNETEVEVEINERGKTILYLIMLILLIVLLAHILKELKMQNSYFINALYRSADSDSSAENEM